MLISKKRIYNAINYLTKPIHVTNKKVNKNNKLGEEKKKLFVLPYKASNVDFIEYMIHNEDIIQLIDN